MLARRIQRGLQQIDVVDAWDFDDEELVSVLGKKGYRNEDELYGEILRAVRANPLN